MSAVSENQIIMFANTDARSQGKQAQSLNLGTRGYCNETSVYLLILRYPH